MNDFVPKKENQKSKFPVLVNKQNSFSPKQRTITHTRAHIHTNKHISSSQSRETTQTEQTTNVYRINHFGRRSSRPSCSLLKLASFSFFPPLSECDCYTFVWFFTHSEYLKKKNSIIIISNNREREKKEKPEKTHKEERKSSALEYKTQKK